MLAILHGVRVSNSPRSHEYSHPEVRDICDIGRILFGGSKIAYELTMVGLVLNNIFIQALHIVVGEKVLNTLTNHAICTVAFGAILTVVYFVCMDLVIVT